MSKIQEKLDSLQPYVNGIRYIQGMRIVDSIFNHDWIIPESEIIGKELVDKTQNYYMFFCDNEDISFDDLLDYVENIIKVNIEREQKNILLKSKFKELQELFKVTPLEDLEKLEFNLNRKNKSISIDGDEMDISMDSESDVQITTDNVDESFKEGPIITSSETYGDSKQSTTLFYETKGQTIELPPKDLGIDEPCTCSYSEACEKCIDTK